MFNAGKEIEAMKRLTLHRIASSHRFIASSLHRFIASIAQLWTVGAREILERRVAKCWIGRQQTLGQGQKNMRQICTVATQIRMYSVHKTGVHTTGSRHSVHSVFYTVCCLCHFSSHHQRVESRGEFCEKIENGKWKMGIKNENETSSSDHRV